MNYTHHGLGKHMVTSERVTRRPKYTKLPNPQITETKINPLSPELNPICYLLALLAHDFLHVSRIRVKDEMARDIRHTCRFVASIEYYL
jgi:transposase